MISNFKFLLLYVLLSWQLLSNLQWLPHNMFEDYPLGLFAKAPFMSCYSYATFIVVSEQYLIVTKKLSLEIKGRIMSQGCKGSISIHASEAVQRMTAPVLKKRGMFFVSVTFFFFFSATSQQTGACRMPDQHGQSSIISSIANNELYQTMTWAAQQGTSLSQANNSRQYVSAQTKSPMGIACFV